VPGRTFREALRAGAITDNAALEVAAQIADALAHAHGRGIVHRDVKPSNVLLAQHLNTQDGSVDVRLLDFGLAQMAEFDTLTALGDIPGTLAYISPERLQGLPATAAADVWALGVVLWEALAGEHPFWGGDLTETSRSIQDGAPPLETLRPDLPEHVLQTVADALVANPTRRPTAGRLAQELRTLPKRRRKPGPGGGTSVPRRPSRAVVAERLVPAALTAVAAGWVTSTLPFYPGSWPLGLAGVGAVLGFLAPRAGLLFALAAAFLPLANLSLGLAVVYAVLALVWAGLTWKDARTGLLLALGPLLAPVGALALLPLAAQATRGRARRGLQVAAAVMIAAVVAGIRRVPLPFDGSTPPLGLGITGSDKPGAVGVAVWRQLLDHPTLITEALVLAVAAAVLPLARGRGPWPAVFFGGALLAATAIVAPAAALLPLIAAAWVTAGALALWPRT